MLLNDNLTAKWTIIKQTIYESLEHKSREDAHRHTHTHKYNEQQKH